MLGDGPEDFLRNGAELGVHNDFVLGDPGVANDRQGDDFIGVVDENVAGFLVSHLGQHDLLGDIHLEHVMAVGIPFLGVHGLRRVHDERLGKAGLVLFVRLRGFQEGPFLGREELLLPLNSFVSAFGKTMLIPAGRRALGRKPPAQASFCSTLTEAMTFSAMWAGTSS